jgi:non-specific serine/threonine protein kinase
LIDPKKDVHIWAEKYSGTLKDVFDIQEKVSRTIVDALKLKLTPEEKQRIAERSVDDVAAYEYYLRAHQEIFKFTEVAIKQAIRYLKNALDIMGENAFLYSGLAFAYFNLVNIGAEQEDHIVKAEEFVRRALALDGEFPKAHAVLGWIENIRGNQQKAAYHLKKALAVSPVDTLALPCLAAVYFYIGKIDPAAPLCEKLMQIDPLDFATNWVQGGFYFFDGKYDCALRAWSRLHEIYPENPMSQHYYARALAYNKKIEQAFPVIDQCAWANPNNMLAKLGLMLKYGILKDKDRAIHEMTPDFQMTCRRDVDVSHHLAGIFALLEEKKESLDWLENAINRGFINYPMLAEKDPFLANIRDEERFKKLMDRVKYEWEHFEV